MKHAAFKRPRAGFTIIELLVSVAIIGILASVAMPVVQTQVQRQKEQQLRAALMSIRSAIDAYKQAVVNGSIASQNVPSGYPPNLATLVAGVPTISNSQVQIYFLRSIPRDPFYPDQTTPASVTWALRSYEASDYIPPPGDGNGDVFDVQSMSTGVGLNGVPYSQW